MLRKGRTGPGEAARPGCHLGEFARSWPVVCYRAVLHPSTFLPAHMTAPARYLPPVLQKLRFPVIASPLFIISNPKLVIAQCKAGVVGSMPALNARPGGPVAWSGAISSGGANLAAQAMGADLAYLGSAFIATDEARAVDGYKQMITESNSDDIVYSNFYTGIHGNYLKGSIRNAGMDPDHLPESDPSKMNFASGEGANAAKAWKDIWGCGQGIGAIREVMPAAAMVARFQREYQEAKAALLAA